MRSWQGLRVAVLITGILCLCQPSYSSGLHNQKVINLRDEGTAQGDVKALNCVGSSVTCTTSSGVGAITISGGGAPTGASYLVQTADSTLTNEQDLGSLSSGYMKSTTTTGVVSTVTTIPSTDVSGIFNVVTATNLKASSPLSLAANGTLTASIASSDVTGTIGSNRGGTGLTSYTKGDLLTVNTAGQLVNLTVGANGTILSADSSQTTGIKWITAPTSGGAGTPGGTSLGVQINNAGSFNSIPLVSGDTSRSRLAIGPLTSNVISLDVAGSARTVPFTLTDAATINSDASQSNIFFVILGGSRTLAKPSNGAFGQKIMYIVSQDATGSRKLGFAAGIDFGTDVASYDASTTAGKKDLIGMIYNGTSWDVCSISKGFN